MIAKQLHTTTLLGLRSRPIMEDSERSLVELNRPRKRVKISVGQSRFHPCNLPTQGDDQLLSEQPIFYQHQQRQYQNALPTNAWLTSKELSYFRSIAKSVSKSVNLEYVLQDVFDETSSEDESVLRTNKLLQSDDFLIQRGLERWSCSHHAFLRKVKVLEVKAAVFLEQANQVLSGRSDPEMLSKVSVEASRASQRLAQVLAKVDAEMAMEVHASDLKEGFGDFADDDNDDNYSILASYAKHH
jgi:hypothetical protein